LDFLPATRFSVGDGRTSSSLPFVSVSPSAVVIATASTGVAVRVRRASAVSIDLVPRHAAPQRIDLLVTKDAGARLDPDRHLVFDASGRVLLVEDGRVVTEWRIV